MTARGMQPETRKQPPQTAHKYHRRREGGHVSLADAAVEPFFVLFFNKKKNQLYSFLFYFRKELKNSSEGLFHSRRRSVHCSENCLWQEFSRRPTGAEHRHSRNLSAVATEELLGLGLDFALGV